MPPPNDPITINQRVLIENLNKYFKANHLPFKIESEGVCHGLATVHAKYVLEGKEEEFIKILQYISTGDLTDLDSLSQDDLQQFVRDVLHGYNPQMTDINLSQMRAIEVLKIDGKPGRSSFNLGLVTSDDNWVYILKELNLGKDEVATIGSRKHAVSLKRTSNGYVLYDPNYKQGFKTFPDEAALIEELHKNVFGYKAGNMGLQISVIRHPLAAKREFPDLGQIIRKCISEDNIKQTADFVEENVKSIKTLAQAAQFDDVPVITALLALKPDHNDILNAAALAIKHNCTENFKLLFPLLDDREKRLMYILAAQTGRKGIFDKLMEMAPGHFLDNMNALLKNYNLFNLLHLAAASGSPECLNFILGEVEGFLDYNDPKVSEVILSKDGSGEDCITKAIKSGSAKSVEYLMIQVYRELTARQKLDYLVQAIKENQASVVDYLITQVPKESLSAIHMNMPAIDDTQLSILKTLREHDVSFGVREDAKIAKLVDSSFEVSLGTKFKVLLLDIRDWFKTITDTFEEHKAKYITPTVVVKEASIVKTTSFREQMRAARDAEKVQDTKIDESKEEEVVVATRLSS